MSMMQKRGFAAAAGWVVFGLGIIVCLSASAASAAPAAKPRARMHPGLKSGLKSSIHSRHVVTMRGEQVVPGVLPDETATSIVPIDVPTTGKPYQLRLSNMHTGENLSIVYRIGNVYLPEALEKLNYFLRDHNTQDVVRYEPKEFDVLHAVMARLGRTNGLIDVLCGYRTPETNEALRNESAHSGVAEHSQHMEGHAIDMRVPGVGTARLRNAALSLRAGGVGYYPTSQFVHVDVGPVREWVFGATPRRGTRRPHRARSSGTAVGQ